MSDKLIPIWRKRRSGGKWTFDSYWKESEVDRALWNLQKADKEAREHGNYGAKHKGFEFRRG